MIELPGMLCGRDGVLPSIVPDNYKTVSGAAQEREKRLAAAEAEASLHRELQAYAKDLAEAKAAHARVSDEAQAQMCGSKSDHQTQLQVSCQGPYSLMQAHSNAG